MEENLRIPLSWQSFKLKGSYRLLALVSVVGPIAMAGIILFCRRYFVWADNYNLAIIALLGIAVYQILIFILHRLLKWPIFWFLLAVGWPVFYFLIVVATGGVNSSFIFLLVLPLINSTIRLEKEETLAVGVLLLVLLALTIFTKAGNLSDPFLVARHLINLFFFGLIVVYFYQVVSDTLHYKVAKEDVQQQLASVLELSNIKNTFLTTASHQLRTPISAASWALDEIKTDPNLSPESQSVLHLVRERLDKTLKIIDDLLKAAEITTDDYDAKIRQDRIYVSDLLKALVAESQSLARKNRVIIKLSLPQNNPVILGNYQLMFGALLNLVDNAVRYTTDGVVALSLVETNRLLIVKIIDTGIGIGEEDQKHLFERFYRGQNALATDPNRSGVGLSLSRRVIEMHGGKLTLTSRLNQGTTVTVELLPAANS